MKISSSSIRRATVVTAALVLSATVAPTVSAAGSVGSTRAIPAPRADYKFSGDLDSSVGDAPALRNINAAGKNKFTTTTSGGVKRHVLEFPEGNGLRLRHATSVVKRGTYTIALTMKFTDLVSFQRLVNFAGDEPDTGFYTFGQDLSLYSGTYSTGAPVMPDTWMVVVLTRTKAGVVRAYVNGTKEFEVDDSENKYAVISADDQLWFFRDNSNREEGAGAVDRIRLWNVALSPSQVAALKK